MGRQGRAGGGGGRTDITLRDTGSRVGETGRVISIQNIYKQYYVCTYTTREEHMGDSQCRIWVWTRVVSFA